MKTVTIKREQNESEDQFFKRYENKLKELDYTKVTYTNNYATITYNL